MNLKSMTAKEVRDYIMNHSRSIGDDEWLEISNWIAEFLRSDPPKEEKKMFVPLGCAEMVTMICDGIIRRRNAICTQCKKAKSLRECEIYENKIPKEIWTTGKDAICDYFEHK